MQIFTNASLQRVFIAFNFQFVGAHQSYDYRDVRLGHSLISDDIV